MKKTSNKKIILITGKSGFIGKNLSEFIKKNHKENFKILNYQKKYKKSYKIDFIIHLAFSFEKNIKSTNIELTKKVIKLAQNNNSKIIYLSSSAVYGSTSKDLLIKENHKLKPMSEYGKVKILIEKLLKKYSNKHKIPILVLRVFNIVGKYQSKKYLISQIINYLKKGKKLTISNPFHKRDYISVDHLNSIIIKLLLINKKYNYRIFNLGSGKSLFIYQIVNKIIKIYNFDKTKIEFSKNKNLYFSRSCNKKLNQFLNIKNNFNLSKYLLKNKGELL